MCESWVGKAAEENYRPYLRYYSNVWWRFDENPETLKNFCSTEFKFQYSVMWNISVSHWPETVRGPIRPEYYKGPEPRLVKSGFIPQSLRLISKTRYRDITVHVCWRTRCSVGNGSIKGACIIWCDHHMGSILPQQLQDTPRVTCSAPSFPGNDKLLT
jgi:hypothetical protein